MGEKYKINTIEQDSEIVEAIKKKSVDSLPDSPAAYGMRAAVVKPKFWHPLVQGDASLLGVINSLIEQLNTRFFEVDERLQYTKIRINTSTKQWEISTDGGTNWQSTGVKATPTCGEDYWTKTDKDEIKGYVDEAILNGKW